jgi:hypothetical protein
MTAKIRLVLGLWVVFAAAVLAAQGPKGATAVAEPVVRQESIRQTAVSWQSGSGSGYALTAEGLAVAEGSATAVYQSAILAAPFPFNALAPSWIADLPEGSDLEIHLRTANATAVWSEWYDIHAHDDWNLPGNAETIGDMILAPAIDRTHTHVQYQISLSQGTAPITPHLRQLTLTFLNSTAGPGLEEMLAQQAVLDAGQNPAETEAFPRPPVLSRAIWCIFPECQYSEGLTYAPASHLIVHHTATSNSSANWADTVRAIWYYHTFTLGWGDVGYNYLIDRNGVIYEGRLNEDYLNLDVVGTHAGPANSGSLGASLIGTFTTPEENPGGEFPAQPMLESLANLLAWKAEQREIDLYDASRLVNMNWGLPHLIGHRDVYGGLNTLCPGGRVQALLPWLRQTVAQRLGQVSPYTFISETSAAFTRSNNNWFVTAGGCGWQGHAFYTWSVTDPGQSTHWGEWRLTIPQAGRYEIQVYAPYCLTYRNETAGAVYQIIRSGLTETVVVSHQDHVGLWISLGEFDLPPGANTVLRLTDLSTTDSGLGVWFDDVRFRPVGNVAIAELSPADGLWLNQPAVPFSWQFSNPAAVWQTTLEIASDPDFATVLFEQSWPTAVLATTHTFDEEYPALYWRVTTQSAGGINQSATAVFGLDITPPQSAVTAVYALPHAGPAYQLIWSGHDNLSGVATYQVEYQAAGDLNWTPWLSGTVQTSALFSPPDPDGVYYFRSQAVDQAHNYEAPHLVADIGTDQAIILSHVIMLPIISR